MNNNSTLTTFYGGWEKYQQNLIKSIAPLTHDQLNLRAAPNLRSIEELARHIVGARAGWFHQALHEEDENIVQMAQWNTKDSPSRTAAELVHGLETTWQFMKSRLDRWTPEDFAGTVTGVRRGTEFSFTREWIIWHLIEHDLHHGGEISFTLGMNELKGIGL